MWDSYYCNKCKTDNWVNLGDFEDQTAPTVEAYRCRSCKAVNLIIDRDELESAYMGNIEDGETLEDCVWVEDGEAPPGTPKLPTVGELFRLKGTQTGRLSSKEKNERNLPRVLGLRKVTLTLRLHGTFSLPDPEISTTQYDVAQCRMIEALEKQGWNVEVIGEEV